MRNIIFLTLLVIVTYGCDNNSQIASEEFFSRYDAIIQTYEQGNVEKAYYDSQKFVSDYSSNYVVLGISGVMSIDYAKSASIDEEKKKILIAEGLELLERAVEVGSLNQHKFTDAELLGWIKMAIGYATILYEHGHLDAALDTFRKLYEENLTTILTDSSLKYSVIDYAEALAKTGRNTEAITKYADSFTVNNSDPILIQGYVKLLADYINLDEAIFIADDFDRKYGFVSAIAFEKCDGYLKHKVFKKSKRCFESLLSKIKQSSSEYSKSKEKLALLTSTHSKRKRVTH